MSQSKTIKTERVFRTAGERKRKEPGTGVQKKTIVTEDTNTAIVTVETGPIPSHPRKGTKGKGSMSLEECDLMVEAFRDIGPNFTKVALKCGLDRRTVGAAWKRGVKAHDLPPIIGIIETEKLEARKKVAQRWEGELTTEAKALGMDSANLALSREKMSEDAIRGRTEEANMIRLARGDATQTLAAVARMLPGLNKWAKHAATILNDTNPNSVADAVKLMGDVSKVVERTANAANTIMAMERRLLGQPESIVGVQMDDITMEEAMVHVSAMDRTMARARALGLMPELTAMAEPDIDDAEIVEAETTHNAPIISDNEGSPIVGGVES
jgi:hypothetical protein